MTTAELKLDIFRMVDGLKKNQLDELTGLISNYIHGQYGLDDWESLSTIEKKALLDAKQSIRKNGGTEHSTVMKTIRQRFANG